MKTTIKKAYGNGELRVGWSSWDEKELSVKWAYPDKRGGTSIRSPEVPVDVLVELLLFAKEKNLLTSNQKQRVEDAF